MEKEKSQIRRPIPDSVYGDYKPLVDVLTNGLICHTVKLHEFEWESTDINPQLIFLLDGKEWKVRFDPNSITLYEHIHGTDMSDKILDVHVNAAREFLEMKES